ncbi:DUF1015 domain-containing protein [Rhizosphaericola mali]|uniref:DUF1015 domain-containing protein n=1 Tax=Rhizosphaericola mali TaxID=2545455 RepID=A0A5P2GE97_9BACT|nr:DUF1015 family protein [Rhizosphaericola mali]QES89931.1 DUF1015 domain-containing protein [Rhizosphaericola mali]
MTRIRPFKAVRPQPELASQVGSLPYDVLNSDEARANSEHSPYSFLHITKSEIDLPAGTDVHDPIVYQKAKENLQSFLQNNILLQEDKPAYYIYSLTMDSREQTGIVAVSSLDDYENDIIKKHEFTRPEKEIDRINHIQITEAQTGNVFLAYRNLAELDSLVQNWRNNHAPLYDFVAEDGVKHMVWVVDSYVEIEAITELFAKKIPNTYIADGHHRAASAAKVRTALYTESKVEPAHFLTTLFPANQLHIMEYNRVVRDLNGLGSNDFLKEIAINFDVETSDFQVLPAEPHIFGMYLEKQWYSLKSKSTIINEDPIGILDVSILQNGLLDPILGIQDPRTDKRIDFIGGIRGLDELERLVDSDKMKVAFSLYPVTIDQLFAIADSGNVMPPKSTWFEPKLRDGLLTHLINE